MGIDEIIKAKKLQDINPQASQPEDDIEETDFYKTEGIRNSISRLEIFLANGASLAVEYSMMPIIYSASADEIIIPSMVNLKITITGVNLDRLRKRLIDNRVKWIKPHIGTKPLLDSNALFIEGIKIEPAAFDGAVEKLI